MSYNNGFPIGYQPVQTVQQMPQVQQVVPQQQVNGSQQQQQQLYQQPVFQQPQQVVQPPQQSQDRGGIIWVQGDAGAKSYLVAPNTSVMLMDSEADCFYIKSADASGMPLPLRTFDYTERVSDKQVRHAVTQPPEGESGVSVDLSAYITKDEYEARTQELLEQINSLSTQLSEISTDYNKRRK